MKVFRIRNQIITNIISIFLKYNIIFMKDARVRLTRRDKCKHEFGSFAQLIWHSFGK